MPRISNSGENVTYDPDEYVSNGGFGQDPSRQSYPSALYDTYLNLDTTDTVLAEIRLREAYDTKYGIHNHAEEEETFSPFRLVRFYKKEDASTTTLFEYYIERYLKDQVKNHFGYTFSEFLALPIDTADAILLKAHHYTVKVNKGNEELISEFKDLAGGNK